MSRTKCAWAYGLLGLLLVVIDRFTKYEALCWCQQQCIINKHLSFEVVYNRGISWGLFHFHDTVLFSVVTVCVGLLTVAVLWYTIFRFRDGHTILGEVMVLAGSISNITDRVVYRGVIDFVELSYRGWQWPSFNVADTLIVVGVALMAVEYYRR